MNKPAPPETVFRVPFGADECVEATDEEKVDLYNSLLAEAEIALATPLPRSTVTKGFSAARLPSPLLSAACFTCRGRCCYQGLEERGFIKAPVLRRMAAKYPEASAQELAQIYMNKLPDLHVAKQCLFQSNNGCALDREDRSQICNEYLCRHAKAIENSPRDVQHLEKPAMVVSINENEVKRAYVCRKDGCEELDTAKYHRS